ncbi:MAG: PadR family transcriptional regulator [Planctomycetota bacterium]
MARQTQPDLVQGTLDMLVLRVLKDEARHGFAIARMIKAWSSEHLKVEEGSLYPALHRMERRGWIAAEWGLSENNRRAKFYRITPAGKKRLKVEIDRWHRMVSAISGVLEFTQRQVVSS